MRLRLNFCEDKAKIVEDAYFEAYTKSEEAFEKNDYGLALEILDKAIKSNEQSDGDPWERADFYIKCAEIYRARKESDLEFAALTKAIELRGFDWDYQKRACVYAERGDYDNAIEDYTKAIEKDEAPESYQWRGEIFLKKKDYDSAIADFLKAIECCSNPRQGFCKGCLECYYLCDQAYLKKGDFKSAKTYLDKARILIYERDAPKFDVYKIEQRRFANFGDAYLCGLEQIALKKDSSAFCIIGEKFKRRVYKRKIYEDWHNKPFNRSDCEEVCWDFDESGELRSRSYDYYGIGYEYMPSDAEADAGTRFKKGDLVKVYDTVCVISLVSGRKKDNRWENYYTALEIIKKDDGRIYTRHGHFHESNLAKFTEPIDKSEPLWFLHQVFAGEIKLTKKQGNIIDSEIKLVNGKWRGG